MPIRSRFSLLRPALAAALVVLLAGCGQGTARRAMLDEIEAANAVFAAELARAQSYYQQVALMDAPAGADGSARPADPFALPDSLMASDSTAAPASSAHAVEGGEAHEDAETAAEQGRGEHASRAGEHGEEAAAHGADPAEAQPLLISPLDHFRAALAAHELFLERHLEYAQRYREKLDSRRQMQRVLGAILSEQEVVRRQYALLSWRVTVPDSVLDAAGRPLMSSSWGRVPAWLDTAGGAPAGGTGTTVWPPPGRASGSGEAELPGLPSRPISGEGEGAAQTP